MESSSTTRTPRINNTTRAYIAGLFDGEGYFCSGNGRNAPYSTIRIGITNRRKDVLEWIQSMIGGRLVEKHRASNPLSDNPCYELTMQDTRVFLQVVKPYVRIKRAQLEIACAFYSLPRGAMEKKKRLIAKLYEANKGTYDVREDIVSLSGDRTE